MKTLTTARAAGFTYAGPCPEFASHGFADAAGAVSLYTRHGSGFGAPAFTWRGAAMYRVTGL